MTDRRVKIEDLSEILKAYGETSERLQRSHDMLLKEVARLSAELKHKNRLLNRKTRLEVLGEMAAGVAHEIRNPLGGIELYASLLERDFADAPEPLRLIRAILKGVRSLDGIVGDLLSFTRGFEPSPQPCFASEIVEDALAAAVGELARTDIRVERRYAQPDVELYADPGLLKRALLNIVLNAVQAMEQRGTLTAAISFVEGKQGGRCVIEMRDTGPGIAAGMVDRLFEPYATDKEGGTGLGLAIVQKIVEGHNGKIVARNLQEGGASFRIELKAAGRAAQRQPAGCRLPASGTTAGSTVERS